MIIFHITLQHGIHFACQACSTTSKFPLTQRKLEMCRGRNRIWGDWLTQFHLFDSTKNTWALGQCHKNHKYSTLSCFVFFFFSVVCLLPSRNLAFKIAKLSFLQPPTETEVRNDSVEHLITSLDATDNSIHFCSVILGAGFYRWHCLLSLPTNYSNKCNSFGLIRTILLGSWVRICCLLCIQNRE